MFIDIDQSVPDIDALYGQLVVVTAFSLNHMKEAMGMIATAQKIMPQVKIIVYDIGLLEEEAIKKVSTLCNVELRTFNFNKYPRYVSSLLTYAWKVIIIKETLNEFGAIFWADASVRFTKSLKSLLPYAVEHHGYLSRIHSYRALNVKPITHNYYFTNDLMFKSFGIDKKEYSQSPYAPHPAANRQLIINSTTVQLKYMRPMYTCALNKTCISPKGARYMHHRFDASALMLVIHKFFPNEFNRENDHIQDFDNTMYVDRVSAHRFNATYCPAQNTRVTENKLAKAVSETATSATATARSRASAYSSTLVDALI
ncbi:uncharacterized protein LOC117293094 [Asterias rubens]|uniref:uncharacterized protein LOC117293094 n=1 Tax=Asterias rubens TaxID=7604 RepID=UPI001454EA19|nr:uncharacterized protein LOC117293094 [Asterias rubens]